MPMTQEGGTNTPSRQQGRRLPDASGPTPRQHYIWVTIRATIGVTMPTHPPAV
eukprot:jgi/Mesvir1/15526/Mv26137-RA.1